MVSGCKHNVGSFFHKPQGCGGKSGCKHNVGSFIHKPQGDVFGCIHSVGSFIHKPQGLVVSLSVYTILEVLSISHRDMVMFWDT